MAPIRTDTTTPLTFMSPLMLGRGRQTGGNVSRYTDGIWVFLSICLRVDLGVTAIHGARIEYISSCGRDARLVASDAVDVHAHGGGQNVG